MERVTPDARVRAYCLSMTMSPPSLEGLPDSPYAAQLRKARSARFPPAMEAEYDRSFLRDNLALVRLSTTLALLLIALRGLEVAIGSGTVSSRPVFLVVIATSVILAWLAWSRHYEKRYLPWAQVLLPLRNGLVATQLVRIAATGQLDVLVLLPLLLIGPFYFMGLRCRTALFVVLLTGACMLAAMVTFHLPPPIAFRSGAFALVAVVTFAIAAQQIEKRSRRAFLESRLMTELAQHDVLTSAKNRRVFDEYLPRLWRQAAEDARTLAILLFDVDHFKPYNDRYGHQAGDAALRKVAHTIQAGVRRPLDLVARYGGEEFAVILYDTDAARAASTAERVRKAVQDLAIEHRASRAGGVLTISVGVAVIATDLSRSPNGAVQLADEALYRAKSNGRNRVEIMDDAEYRLMVTGVFPQELADQLKQGAVKNLQLSGPGPLPGPRDRTSTG